MRTFKPIVPAEHLIHILRETRMHHPGFTLLLGAGASIQSGVPLASHLIHEWRKILHERSLGTDELETFLQQQTWYETSGEYSELFELLYDNPSQRRQIIETKIGEAEPSVGYVYLVGLLQQSVFNTVFTTNFDDLATEACYLFSSDVRPLVCAHESAVEFVRLTTKRPKIIKLHGDFLFDNIKNTLQETETLERNTRDKLAQYAQEFGLIVIGYSGNDRSIMEALESVLKNRHAYRNGVYWCEVSDQLSDKVIALERDERVKIVNIRGFDEFMGDLYHALEDKPHQLFEDPFRLMRSRVYRLFDRLRIPEGQPHSPISEDLSLLAKRINKPPPPEAAERIPFAFLQHVALERGDFSDAKSLIMQKLNIDPSLSDLLSAHTFLEKHWDAEFAADVVERAVQHSPAIWEARPDVAFSLFGTLAKNDAIDLAEKVLEAGFATAKTQTGVTFNESYYRVDVLLLKRLRKRSPTKRDQSVLHEIAAENPTNEYLQLACQLILDPSRKLNSAQQKILSGTAVEAMAQKNRKR